MESDAITILQEIFQTWASSQQLQAQRKPTFAAPPPPAYTVPISLWPSPLQHPWTSYLLLTVTKILPITTQHSPQHHSANPEDSWLFSSNANHLQPQKPHHPDCCQCCYPAGHAPIMILCVQEQSQPLLNFDHHMCNAIIDKTTGQPMEYSQLTKSEKYKDSWVHSLTNQLGRLAQGIWDIAGTNTI